MTCLILLQLVDLSNSHLSGAIVKFPKDEFDFDPDWEIDPRDVIIMDKLGTPLQALLLFKKYLLFLSCKEPKPQLASKVLESRGRAMQTGVA